MSASKPAKPDVVTYGDHELITPDTKHLRKLLRAATPDDPDPVVCAEQALARISSEFGTWMLNECERLDVARRAVGELGLLDQTRQELFLAAHDIKGGAGTFGYPEVVPAAESLCRLIEHAPDVGKIPQSIIDQHVDAVRAIVREHARSDIGAVATDLAAKLRSVTDEFLVSENRDRPDVLSIIQSPSLVPGEIL